MGRGSAWLAPRWPSFVVMTLPLLARVDAHGGHMDKIPPGAVISDDPIDAILWTHIILMVIAFGMVFPAGMVLGIVRSRWHIPVQTVGTIVATVAYFLGHAHKGRQFKHNIHVTFASSLVLMLLTQIGLGVYLRLHLERGIHARIRKYAVTAHGVVGKLMPVVAWVQMLFGGITAMGYCREDHLGQCLAHFIMGSAFIGYGITMTILLLVGQAWLRRTGRSQEFFDSILITAWGCVNTFTEHRWGQPWGGNDLQHTSMGVVWWCAGLLGIWLSRSRGGGPRRNLLPGLVILLTGWGMSAHPQSLPLSTMVHTIFGYTLMAAGLTRIIEISFVLRDNRSIGEPNSFQHLPPFLLYASGFLFMGATEEQMQFLSDAHVTHVSYILILYSVAFLLYLFVNILLHLYAVHALPGDESSDRKLGRATSRVGSLAVARKRPGPSRRRSSIAAAKAGAGMNGSVNGKVKMAGQKKPTESQQMRDAEEFELEALMSEADDNDGLFNPKETNGIGAGRIAV